MQVTIQLPQEVVDKAKAAASAQPKRPDGLKQTPTAVLREWILKGMGK